VKIVVLVKAPRPSPDSTERIAALPPCDFAALSLGIRLKNQLNAQNADSTTLAVLSAGPTVSEKVLAETLTLGADNAYRVWPEDSDEVDQIDGNVRAIAELLSKAAAHIGFDIIISGDHSADWSSGITGPAIAFNLRIPHCTSVLDLSPCDDEMPLRLTYKRSFKKVTFRIKPPFLVTTCEMRDLVRPSAASGDESVVETLSTVEVGFEPDDPLPWEQEDVEECESASVTPLADAQALLSRLRASDRPR
jgi:electron transfer flavoprotein alpha/beta subunit